MEKASFEIEELSGRHTGNLVKQALDTLTGVMSVSINQQTDHVAVSYDSNDVSRQKIKEKLVEQGLSVTAESGAQHHGKPKTKHGGENKTPVPKKADGEKSAFAGDNPNHGHNVKKEALGPNTKRK